MDFFERQRQVKRMSFRLILLYVLAVLAIVVVVCLAVAFALGAFEAPAAELAWLMFWTAVLTGGSILLASLFRTIGLRAGGGKVARDLGGVLVPEDTTDLRLRRLRNVVEEVALASGVPVPEVYVLEDEQGINAFAAGWSPADAAIAVTRGALDRLNRDELQGVIAHEFSHVLNGDMRINIRLIGLLFGILFLAIMGRTFLYAGAFGGRERRDNQGSNPLPLIGIALIVAGSVGVFAGRLIQASVSRQREYLADASAVQFTRQTSGIAGALKKIGGLETGSRMATPKIDEVGHMLFGPARLRSLFATHPPLADRIRALEPGFDPAQLTALAQQWRAAPPSGLAEDAAMGLSLTEHGGPLPGQDTRMAVRPDAVAASVGAPQQPAYQRAESILERFPPEVLARARRGDTAPGLLFGLLLSEQPEVRDSQLSALRERHGESIVADTVAAAGWLAGLHPLLRLPLGQLCFPALRAHPAATRQDLLGTIDVLARADGRVSVFEYALSRLLHRDLYEATYETPPWPTRKRSLATCRNAIASLLAVLARAGHPDEASADHAYHVGLAMILPGQPVPMTAPQHGVLALDGAWPLLDGLAPRDKSLLIQAVVAVISEDGTMTVAEQELTRTVCGMLHCPLPPLTALPA
ncbi:M48 family metallopeptidase [Catellatospora sichuanensis]|uniref:M48 family metallopeptidase n=1 Tax=Catellatospora sichuanensis TaxID=1969805 RepID=UPI00118351BE|nr:M48 family metallopeptidase [Catellatospora sichuanensis]